MAANAIALTTHAIVQPLDLVKIRSQVLQEGKPFTGIGFGRGFHPFEVYDEIYRAGGGLRKMYTGFDGFVARTMAYTTARVWGYLYFYDKLNPDPRRTVILKLTFLFCNSTLYLSAIFFWLNNLFIIGFFFA